MNDEITEAMRQVLAMAERMNGRNWPVERLLLKAYDALADARRLAADAVAVNETQRGGER